MKPKYHWRITVEALAEQVSPAALTVIVAANLGQDALRYQFGHDHFHYDNNSFVAGDAYIEEQRRVAQRALAGGSVSLAWQAFGRLTHAAQDFYAHSNYVTLWREYYPAIARDEILPLLKDVSAGVHFHSGRLYYPLEILSFLPWLGQAVTPILPRDSHARMNKDDPSRPDFDLAYTVAVKRTVIEFQTVVHSITPEQAELFIDKS